MIDYRWAEWLEALATTIAENGERYLAEHARAVDWGKGQGRSSAPGIRRREHRSDVVPLLPRTKKHHLPVRRHLPKRPPSVRHRSWISPNPGHSSPHRRRTPRRCSTMGIRSVRICSGACSGRRRQSTKGPPSSPEDFNAVLKLPNVGMSKLTQTLFIANPCHYLPAVGSDKWTLPYLVIPNSKGDVRNYEDYLPSDGDLSDGFFPGCEVPTRSMSSLTLRGRRIPLSRKRPISFRSAPMPTMTIQTTGNKPVRLEEDLLFNENHYVYTGGAGGRREYPLKRPKRGDVVLVRYRPWEGRAIGVVEENEYHPDGWNEERVIRVHWINKTSARLDDHGTGEAGCGGSVERK